MGGFDRGLFMRKIILAASLLLSSTGADAATSDRCKNILDCIFNTAPRHQIVQPQEMALSGGSHREMVRWSEEQYPTGSIIVRTPERALFFVTGKGEAMRYAVGVGREGFQWGGTSRIVAKAEWPGWTPPPEMITREAKVGHIIPPHMDGGPGNPLGARAMYLGGRMYRIHGTNNEASIGGAVSSGCIRMMNADVIDLYERTKVGAKVWVYQ